jgi:gp16 family phage-associated protein
MKKQAPDFMRLRAKSWFADHGISVSGWARDHGFPRQVVVDVLHGRCQGIRGKGHAVAVALGIKKAVVPAPLKRAA